MLTWLLFAFVRWSLWLRYRVEMVGLECIAEIGCGGIVFMPSHPALIDPVIILSRLFRLFRPRALADRDRVDRFFIRYLATKANVIRLSSLTKQLGTADEVQDAISLCADVLRKGDNVLFYPAGRLSRTGRESLGANSGAWTLLREAPDARVVLVRTRGLWGSAFSWGGGAGPKTGKGIRRGLPGLLASFLLLAPRRKVVMEFVEAEDFPRGADRSALNTYLEEFYNASPEANTYVPYSIWERGGVRTMPEPDLPEAVGDLSCVSAATREIVGERLRDLTGIETFDDSTDLARDLGMDSLGHMDLATWLQEEFGFRPSDLDAFRTVGDVLLIASGQAVSGGRVSVDAPDKTWRPGKIDPYCPPDLADMTVPQAFLAQVRRAPSQPIVADQTSGVRTNRELVLGVRLLGDRIAQLPGETVGVMMPASVGATASFLAVLFAGKTPAMVNWTLGLKNVLHCLELAGVQRIVTARALVDRLARQGVDLGGLSEMFVFIEDIRAGLGRWAKIKAAAASYGPGAFGPPKRPTPETAVILFTSGSESTPKAVGLTHRNLLTNLVDMYQRVRISAVDAMFGILPPFHSFGLATSVILPLCLGLRTVYHPDPTDSATLGEIAGAYQTTLLAGTPTFLAGILQATPAAEKLSSLRLVVSGAEKCPDRLYQALRRQCPQTTVLEGYGATECSPVISVNHQDDPMPGTIGRPMASLAWAVVDPETLERRSPGERGMLLVRGPSVFGGYLNYTGASPFVAFEGHPWYRTGDLVVADTDGVLTFSGRLKRFVKIGGEMISLPAVEEVLNDAFDSGDSDGPVLAVSHAGEEGHAEIVLFATIAVERQAANEAIRSAGLSGLHNVRRVIRVESLPLLGSGKVDHRALRRTLGDDV